MVVNDELMMINYLVGGFSPYPSEKYDFVSWDDNIPNIWKNKKCSKPPTSLYMIFSDDINVENHFSWHTAWK